MEHGWQWCFWNGLPDRGLVDKGKSWRSSKKSKQRVTVAFLSMLLERRSTNQLLPGTQRSLNALNELTKHNYLFSTTVCQKRGWLEVLCIVFAQSWTAKWKHKVSVFSSWWIMLDAMLKIWLASIAVQRLFVFLPADCTSALQLRPWNR